MKDNLLFLIKKTDQIEMLFHFTEKGGNLNTIYNVPQFLEWKQEVQFEMQEIFDRTRDQFIWDTLILCKQSFNGWRDKESFIKLKGNLLVIRKNIEKYFPNDGGGKEMSLQEECDVKEPKVFISHSSEDKGYAKNIVDLLLNIGLREKQIFCSSLPGFDIPLGEDIYEYLQNQLNGYKLHVFFLLSRYYYQSPAALNEMGAAWILKHEYTTILLPDFEYIAIKGAVNPQEIGLKLDQEITEVKDKLGQLKDTLIKEFGLDTINATRWEAKRDDFISKISVGASQGLLLSDYAEQLLNDACNHTEGEIQHIKSQSEIGIVIDGKDYITSQGGREVAKWESALNELVENRYIKLRSDNREVSFFSVTESGYQYYEKRK